MPSNDINDVLTGANVLGDVTVRFSKESGGLIKSLKICVSKEIMKITFFNKSYVFWLPLWML